MNFKIKNLVPIISLFFGATYTYAQEGDTEIKKEDVVVEFSFSPTLSNVFKLKSTPNVAQEFPKKTVTYKINTKQVASDFVPVTKKAMYVQVDENKVTQYPNYVYGAAGIYGNGEFELMLRPKKNKKGHRFGVDLSSYNAQNGIEDERVANGQWQMNAAAFLAKQNKKSNWVANVAYDRNQIHWYGLDATIPSAIYEGQDVVQIYNKVDVSGKASFKKGMVKNVAAGIQIFSDDYNNAETQLNASTLIDKSKLGDLIDLGVDFEYLSGSFDQSYLTDDNINYSFINAGITPKYTYKSKTFKIDAGLGLYLNIDQEASETNFVLLPNLQIDWSLLENIMTLKTGLRSQLLQNSYASLAKENPWISPTQTIETTQIPVDAFLGLEGKLTKTLSYNTEISYKQVKDKVLFLHNNSVDSSTLAYQMGNSFSAVYDDVSVFSFKGSLETRFLEKLTGGLTATFNSYTLDTAEEAWNLPTFTLETYTNYTHKKVNAHFGVNFMGTRKDVIEDVQVDVDSFVDVNLKVAYAITDQFYVHVNLYNVLNNQYQTYSNYQVQGFQALGGLSYKF